MRKLNLPLIADTIFTGICAFLLFFTAVRYYTKSAALGLAFGIAAAALGGALAFLYISGKQNKKLLLSRDERQKKLLSLHLSLSSDGYILNLFKKCLGEDAKIRGKRIVSGDKTCFFDFKMQPLGEDDVAKVIKYKSGGEKIVYCTAASPEAALLADNFLIKITDINGVYPLLKEKDLLPEKYAYEGAQKRGFFKRIKSRFSRRLCVPLFWSGAALTALSYFTFYPLYYVISGGLLLILAAVALVFGRS